MYKPTIATTDIPTYSNKIVGIQGPPGSGKTVSSLTFPNPVMALFEKPDLQEMLKIPMLAGVEPMPLPFYDTKWLEKCKFPLFNPGIDGYKSCQDPAGAFLKWLKDEGRLLTNDQTLVVDNWTRLQERFDELNWSYKTWSKKGEDDHYAPWDRKIDFSENVSNALVSLACNVVILFHEIQERDKTTGAILEKVQPLQKGQFVVKLKTYFPNFFRQHCVMKKGADGKDTTEREYLWQVLGSSNFDAKCSKYGLGTYVPATYKSLI